MGLEVVRFDPQRAAIETWDALIDAEAFELGEQKLASGATAGIKINAEKLYDHPKQLETVLGHMASHPCVRGADVLMYVAEGMRRPMQTIADTLGKPIAHTVKVEHAPRYTFAFASKRDEAIAMEAESLAIGEDVVSTFGSIYGTAKLVAGKDVRSVAMLLRGAVDPEYGGVVQDHYLAQRYVSPDAAVFLQQLQADQLPELIVANGSRI